MPCQSTDRHPRFTKGIFIGKNLLHSCSAATKSSTLELPHRKRSNFGRYCKSHDSLRGVNEVFLNLLDTLRILLNSLVILENDDSGHVY